MPEFRIGGRHAAETVDWLRSIASLVIEEHIGARGNGSDAPAGAGPTDPPGRLRARWKVVEPCVDRLSPRQRQVVELRYREGMRYSDIADSLGIPIGTVRSRLARARIIMEDRAGEPAGGEDAGSESVGPSPGRP